jgi:isoleucyl-tRNA synthetase
MPQDKIDAYLTLYEALVTVSKLAAPMIPFMTEEIYRNLVCSLDRTAPESVHLCRFPEADESLIDRELEREMNEVLSIVVIGRACRNSANIKTRQPIAAMYVKAEEALPAFCLDILAEELNVKSVCFTDDVRAFTSYSFKPQLRTVGPKYGKYLGEIRELLANLDGNAAMDELTEKGSLTLTAADGTALVFEESDLLISTAQTEGFVSASEKGVTVALDTRLSDALIEEGFVREIISKVQTMRKESGFEVTDHICLGAAGNERILAVIGRNSDEIKSEILADEYTEGMLSGNEKKWNINGEEVTLSVEKL